MFDCNKQLTKDFVPDYLHVEGQKKGRDGL
jgi:hypothetical protein